MAYIYLTQTMGVKQMTTIYSRASYLGSTNNENRGFTVDKEYKINDFGDGYIGVFDDYGVYRYIENGEFHKFRLHKFRLLEVDDSFVTETECAVTPTLNDEKTKLRYYINGNEVEMIEFENVRFTVEQLDEDGVKCDTIKFEVKFE